MTIYADPLKRITPRPKGKEEEEEAIVEEVCSPEVDSTIDAIDAALAAADNIDTDMEQEPKVRYACGCSDCHSGRCQAHPTCPGNLENR